MKRYTESMLTLGDHVLSPTMTLFVEEKDVSHRECEHLPRFCVWDEESDTHPLFTESVGEALRFINALD